MPKKKTVIEAPPVCTRPPLEEERKIGNRVLKKGEIIKITGKHGTFKIQGFRGNEVHVYGGTPNRQMLRVFLVDRIGARPVGANKAAREKAEAK